MELHIIRSDADMNLISGEIEDRTMDDNFSDFSKPASFRSSYSSNYTTQVNKDIFCFYYLLIINQLWPFKSFAMIYWIVRCIINFYSTFVRYDRNFIDEWS